MKIGDMIAIPGRGEFMLCEGTNLCLGCVAFSYWSGLDLCEQLPTTYCTNPKDETGKWPNLIFLKVEK